MTRDAPYFDDFLEASSLDRHSIVEYSAGLARYDDDDRPRVLEYPSQGRELPSRRSRLGSLSRRRRSGRDFGAAPLTEKELGQLLESLRGWNGHSSRAYPSAGASYATEAFVIGFHCEGVTGRIAYYDPERHALVDIGREAPSWPQASPWINAPITGTPGVLVVITSFTARATDKYGERAGRFLLLEAGAAMQQLSLAVAESKRMHGVVVGGLLDDQWLRVLGLEEAGARVVIGYLAGVGTQSSRT